jgi:DNA-binding beta-propeller fold protein YncE
MKAGCWVVAWVLGAASMAEAAEFTKKPTATVVGTNVVVTFAVDRPCDVAVAILNGEGKTVRHLAAGVLGANAPAPFVAGSLEQAVTWDGTDDFGKPLPAGEYQARVGLGMGVKLDKVIGDDRQAFSSINAIAVGPQGEVYIYDGGRINVLDRQGQYVRQILPFPADLAFEKLAGLKPVRLPDGALLVRRDYPSGKWTESAVGSMAISPDGRMLYLPGSPRYARNLTRIGTDGSVPANAFDTRLSTHADNGYLYLACSPDGKTLYMAGAQAGYMGDDARELSYRQSVYRLLLDSPGPAEIFTGDEENWGHDGFSVDNPKGLATDPAGRLYVCNYGHDDIKETDPSRLDGNVAVYTPRAGFLKSFRIPFPQQVAVNPKTGQLYVLCGRESGRYQYGYNYPEVMHEAKIVRLSPAGKVEAEIVLDPPYSARRKNQRTGEFQTQAEFMLRMAVDFSDAAKPVVWVGVASPSASYAKWGLLRIEDLGDRFGEPKDVCSHDKGSVRGSMARMSIDRDRGILYLSNDGDNFKRYNALTGALMDPLRVVEPNGQAAKVQVCEQGVGPDGVLYFLAKTDGYATGTVFRCGPDGRLMPYAAEQPKVTHMLKGAGANSARGFAVSRRGEAFVLYYDDRNRPADKTPPEPWDRYAQLPVALAKFAPDGTCVTRHLVYHLRAGANGVRIDSRGNVYVADNFMPAGVTYPADIAKVMPEDPLKRPYPARLADASFDPLLRWMGSVLKFGPQGGTVVGMPEDAVVPPVPRAADDIYRPVPAAQWFMFNYHHLKVAGAEWQFQGISPIPAQYQGVAHVERCVCTGARFDVDPFDRVFVPDTIRHRFTVLDAAGNIICRIGQYGNRDSDGLGLSSPSSVAAAGDYAFLGDGGNRRLVRVNVTYVTQATCPVNR